MSNCHNEETSLKKISLPTPRNTKVFSITNLSFTSFDELIHESSEQLGIMFEVFFGNTLGTQWGYMQVIDGKVKKTIPLLELNILSVTPVNPDGLYADGYIVKYCICTRFNVTEKYIASNVLMKNGLVEYFSITPPCTKKNADMCNRLIRQLILEKAHAYKAEDYIEIGALQGWRKRKNGLITFETRDNYPEVLYPVLPKSILHRERPKFRVSKEKYRIQIQGYMEQYIHQSLHAKVLYLFRIASYNSTFANACALDFGMILHISLDRSVSSNTITAILKNDSFSSTKVLTTRDEIRVLRERIKESNDATFVVLENNSIDKVSKKNDCLTEIENAIASSAEGNHFIAVIISLFASQVTTSDLYFHLNLDDSEDFTNIPEPSLLTRALESNDACYLSRIENDYEEYYNLYRLLAAEISLSVPQAIPPNRRAAYICLKVAAECYNAFYEPLFDPFTLDFIKELMCIKPEQRNTADSDILSFFGQILNQEIQSGRFRFIQRKKYIIFDKGTDSVIVDEENVYFETDVIKALAEDIMDLCSVNALTDVMKETEVLAINDHNSKCYRFHVQSSSGTPYLLYTYGISKKLINAENRRMLDLADKADFLLDRSDFDSPTILPLGMISAGRYIGKDITFGSKSNNHVFVTGQIGNGKTFYVTNLLPSIAMLGGNAIVIDISKSFTKEEALRAVPQRIVDTLFDFVDVGKGRQKLPVNPLYIGDCVGLPAKKRRIVGFVKAAAGKLSTEDARLVAGLVSERLKGHDEISVFTPDMLRSTLEEGGKAGHNALKLITSVLDDLEEIGYEEQGWGEFFSHSKRIPVILLHDADGANVHPLVDTLLQSAFEWQRDHATKPLTVTIDEIKDQSFSDGSPLHTILSQGRKFGMRLIGITQDYISNSSHSIDVMKQAGIKILFKPAKSRDRIAAELGYRNAVDAGFGSMKIGEFIVSCDLYNKEEGVNEPVIIPAKTVKFTELPLYDRFREEYGIN